MTEKAMIEQEISENRKWLPSAWMDEAVPEQLERPESYLEQEGEVWALRLPVDNPDRDNEFYRTVVEPGQVVNFMASENYGHFILVVAEDRSFSTDRPYPEKANCFWLPYDIDTLQYTLKELVDGGEHFGEPLEAGEHTIGIYWWSDDIPMRFEVEDGIGQFVVCGGAN